MTRITSRCSLIPSFTQMPTGQDSVVNSETWDRPSKHDIRQSVLGGIKADCVSTETSGGRRAVTPSGGGSDEPDAADVAGAGTASVAVSRRGPAVFSSHAVAAEHPTLHRMPRDVCKTASVSPHSGIQNVRPPQTCQYAWIPKTDPGLCRSRGSDHRSEFTASFIKKCGLHL